MPEIPHMLRPRHDLLDHRVHRRRLRGLAAGRRSPRDLARLGDERLVEAVRDLVHPVPMRVVGRHHQGAMTRPPTFVVPEEVPVPLDRLVELLRRDQGLLREFGVALSRDS